MLKVRIKAFVQLKDVFFKHLEPENNDRFIPKVLLKS
jgi:hypothetical protein